MGPIEEDMKEMDLSPEKDFNLIKSSGNFSSHIDSPLRPFKIQRVKLDSSLKMGLNAPDLDMMVPPSLKKENSGLSSERRKSFARKKPFSS